MALNANEMASSMIAKCRANGLLGWYIPRFCKAVSEGVIEGFISAHEVITSDVGFIQFGKGIGKILPISPNDFITQIDPLCLAYGFTGPMAKNLSDAVATAIVLHFNAKNEIATWHIGIAQGKGSGYLIGLIPQTIATLIKAKMKSAEIDGVKMEALVDAISQAFVLVMLSKAIVDVNILGFPVIAAGVLIPGTGIGFGKVK